MQVSRQVCPEVEVLLWPEYPGHTVVFSEKKLKVRERFT